MLQYHRMVVEKRLEVEVDGLIMIIHTQIRLEITEHLVQSDLELLVVVVVQQLVNLRDIPYITISVKDVLEHNIVI